MKATAPFQGSKRPRLHPLNYRPRLEPLERRLVPSNFVPGQFIAKMYTEVLGRAPHPPADAGWSNYTTYFTTNACSAQDSNHVYTSLDTVAKDFYTSTEYNTLMYDNPAKVLTLYRGILNREPDTTGLSTWVNALNNNVPIASIVDDFFNPNPNYTPEIGPLVSRICMPSPLPTVPTPTQSGSQWPNDFWPSYGFSYSQPIDLSPAPAPLDPVAIINQYGPRYHPFTGYGADGTADPTRPPFPTTNCIQDANRYKCYDELQTLLDNNTTNAIVVVPAELVIRLAPTALHSGTLNIPRTDQLFTWGTNNLHTGYARNARFVRDVDPTATGSFHGPLIDVMDNAMLSRVTVDGERGRWAHDGQNNYQEPLAIDPQRRFDSWGYSNRAINVMVGKGATVDNIVSVNAAGASSIIAGIEPNMDPMNPNIYFGEDPTTACPTTNITSNLVTAYTGGQRTPLMSDGTADSTKTVAQSDGIQTYCENTQIMNDAYSSYGNDVVDASDVALVMFRVQGPYSTFSYGRDQATTIQYNYVLNAGNSANGGIAADPLHPFTDGQPHPAQWDFSNSKVLNNYIWTAPGFSDYNGHTVPDIHIALAIGTLAYFSDSLAGFGPTTFSNNVIPSGTVLNGTYYIAISGFPEGPSNQLGAIISNNSAAGAVFQYVATNCPQPSANFAAGWFGTSPPPDQSMPWNGLHASYSSLQTQALDDLVLNQCAIGP